MTRKRQETNRVDELLDELLTDYQSPEEILGESGLLKQLTQRLIERALVGELSHHLRAEGTETEEVTPASSSPRNRGCKPKPQKIPSTRTMFNRASNS
jgi:putative transposase